MNSQALHVKVLLLAVLNAVLVTAGASFQKLNAVRSSNVVVSGWLIAAAACLVPTFFIGNVAFAIGGRMSHFVPVTAVTYVLSLVVGKVAFCEDVGTDKVVGCLLIVAGVALIARR